MRSNIALNVYVFKRVFRTNPKLFLFMAGAIITSGIVPYIGMLIMKEIIRMLEMNIQKEVALLRVVVLVFFAGVVYSLKAFFGNTLLPYMNDYRQREKRLLYKNAVNNDLQVIETSEFWTLFQKAQLSVRRNYAGNEGILHNWVDLGASCIPFFLAIIAIKEFDIVIIGIIMFFALLGNLVMSKADFKLTEQEISLYPLRYKAERFYRIMSDISTQKEMRIGKAFDMLMSKYNKFSLDLEATEKKIYRQNFIYKIFLGFMLLIQDIIIYAILIWRYQANKFDIAQWTLLIAAMSMVTMELSKLSGIITQIKSNCAMVDEFRRFLEFGQESKIYEDDISTLASYKDTDSPILCLKNVYLKYKEFIALKNINITINKGEKVAIVGLNGAGKSTLIKLLIGLYHPDEGEVFFEGENIKNISKEYIFSKTSCLFQDVNIYPYSVLTNVSLSAEEKTDTNKIGLLFQNLSDKSFVETLAQKEYTILSKEIDSNGVDLSGGQKQMVALARAFYRNADLLIFDEPTAALDPIAEKKVFKKISELASDKTVIFVSHRIESTTFCDKIILLKDGEVVECGIHKDLLEKKGIYYELFNLQGEFDLKTK